MERKSVVVASPEANSLVVVPLPVDKRLNVVAVSPVVDFHVAASTLGTSM